MRLVSVAVFLSAVCMVALRADAAPARPNILFFLVDDLGYTDLGCFGSTFYETPRIDALAGSGMRLTSAYAACPVCSPTRASLMTGRYPARMATTEWFGAAQPDAWKKNTRLLPARYADRLPPEPVTIAEALRDAGYATFFAGKWHLGPEGSWPEDHGFQINKGGCEWGAPKRHGGRGGYFSPYGNPRLADGPDGQYLTDRLADETASFIRRHTRGQTDNAQPFFACLSFYTVHNPQQAPADRIKKFAAKRERLGTAAADRWITEGDRRVRAVQNQPTYAAMVASLDRAVGRVLDALDQAGATDETIVLFTSDNGGLSTAEGSPTSNLPLRTGKGWLYEGGVREPTLVRWPGVTAPGSTSDDLVTSPDFYPTLLEMVGLPTLPKQHVDGESFADSLRGKQRKRGPAYWHYPHYSNQGGGPGAAVRDGRWKLIEWYETGGLELYDLASDPAEQHDRSKAEPETTARLKQKLDAWRKEAGARMPTPNPRWQPAPSLREGAAQRGASTKNRDTLRLVTQPTPAPNPSSQPGAYSGF